MAGYIRRVTTRNLISPYGLALLSSLIFLTAWAAPPSLFMDYAGEPDILYFNPVVFLFFAGCVVFFLAGVRAFEYFKSPGSIDPPIVSSGAPLTFVLIPLTLSTLICAASVVVLNGKVSNLLGLLLSQQGALIKLAGASGQSEEGAWGYALTIQTGVLWWAYARAQQLKLPTLHSRTFKVCFLAGMLIALGTALIKVDRTNLIPIIEGVFLIYLYARLSRHGVTMKKLAVLCAGLVVAVLVSFSAISYIRGASNSRLLAVGIFGYTAASYNRLAAEVTGLLHYSFGGRGIYLSDFLAFNNTVNRIIPFNELMGSPTSRGVYFSEFSSIAASGLNPGFNWPGAFGYIFADIGWWTPVYLFPVGTLNGYLWRRFRSKSVAGIVLYPWAAFSILFWFGWNVLFDLRFALLAVTAIGLSAYEYCLLASHAATAEAASQIASSPVRHMEVSL